jgi:hypothetical protein
MIKLTNILQEITISSNLREGALLSFVKNNLEEISKLNDGRYEEIIHEGDEPILLGDDFWHADDYHQAYEDYPYEEFIKDWKKYKGSIVICGEELSTVFISGEKLPQRFAAVATANDMVFWGTRPNPHNPFKEYIVNGRKFQRNSESVA